MEKVAKITKETLIPIGLVITCFCAVWFMAKLDYRVTDNRLDINSIQSEIKEMKESLNDIKGNVNIMTRIMEEQNK